MTALRCPRPRGAGGTTRVLALTLGSTACTLSSMKWRRGRVGRAVPCPPLLPTRVTLGPGRRARSVAPYLAAIPRGRWPVLGSINPDPGILHSSGCIRSALGTEAGVITKRSACAKNPQVGRAVLCPPRLPTRASWFTTPARTEWAEEIVPGFTRHLTRSVACRLGRRCTPSLSHFGMRVNRGFEANGGNAGIR